MQRNRRDVLAGLLVAGFAEGIPLPAVAEGYPSRGQTIRLVVPAVAGGGLDIAARVAAQGIAEIWNQQTIVENKPGANWIIGMNTVAKADPDGYNLLVVSTGGLSVNPLVFSNIPFDAPRDLKPVAAITQGTYVLAVHPSVPVSTVPEFIAYLKANPGKLNHGASSASTVLLAEYFRYLADVDFVSVNYRGGAAVVNDTIGGSMQFCFSDLGSALPAVREGQLKALGTTSQHQYELVPDLPPLTKYLPGLTMDGGVLLVAPGKTPGDIVEKLNAVVSKLVEKPDVGKLMRSMGNLPGVGSPDDIRHSIQIEADRWAKLIKERNIHFE